MKLIYKPFALFLGLLAGFLSKKIFDQVWGLIDDREPPQPHHEEAPWPKIIAAAAVEGITFKVTRAAIERAGHKAFAGVTGEWPGPKEPDPE